MLGDANLVAIGVYVPKEAEAALIRYCRKKMQSKSGFVRSVLLDYMQEHKIWDDEKDTQDL